MKHNQNYLTQFKKKISLIRYLICTNINLKTLLKKYKNRCKELYNENLTNELHYNKQKKVIIKEYTEIRNENKQLMNEVYELTISNKMIQDSLNMYKELHERKRNTYDDVYV